MVNTPPLPVPSITQIITDALIDAGVCGIDEAIEPAILNRAFTQVNSMLAQWQVKRWLVYHLVDYSLVSTGAQSYGVGAGLSFNINPRPDRIESAFLRLVNNAGNLQPDLPLDIIPSMEDYNRIVLKTMGTLPQRIFYDTGWPNGTLRPWPIPQASIYELHITFKETLNQFQNLQAKVNLPPIYVPAIQFCLASRLRAVYQMPADPELNKFARQALAAIRTANVQIGVLSMPRGVRRQGGGAYSYQSDTP